MTEPLDEFEGILNDAIDDELARWERSIKTMDTIQQQFIVPERAYFGLKMFLWGKRYGVTVAIGTVVFDDLSGYDPADVDADSVRQLTWRVIRKRDSNIERTITAALD